MTEEQEPPLSRRAARDSGKPAKPRKERAEPVVAVAPGFEQSAADEQSGTPAAGRGLRGVIERNRLAFTASALSAAFLLLGTGAVFAGAATAAPPKPVSTTAAPVEDPPRLLPETLPAGMPLRTCSVSQAASDPRLLTLYGSVINVDTQEVLYSLRADEPQPTASVLKTMTAAAAISVLGPDYRLVTRVVEGSEPGSIVLVGGGDATLSRLPAGQESVYPGAPKLADLAAQTIAAYEAKYPDEKITEVVLDASYWNPADRWHASWDRKGINEGYHSEVTALQVDGDRQDPRVFSSPRGTQPIMRAGEAFVSALGLDDVRISEGVAPAGAPQLAAVESAQVKTLVNQMLLKSDNTIAEMLARVVSKASGFDGSAASLQQAIPRALDAYGVDTSNVVVRDGSGLSHENAVPAQAMAGLMVSVANKSNGLEHVFAGLPVAGKSGTLSGRFTGDSAEAAGLVHAKTGWVSIAHTLGGYIAAKDGSRLAFTFYSVGAGITFEARTALDALATAVYRCGNNLSNI